MMQTLQDLIERNPNAILATYLVGSRAYGTSTPQSDEDYRGIFVLPGRQVPAPTGYGQNDCNVEFWQD